LRCCRDCSWPHKCVSNLAPDSSGPFCAARRARSRRPLRRSECPMWRTLYEGLHKRSGVNRRQWPALFWLQTMLNAWTNYDKLKNLTRSCHRDPSRNSAIGGSHLLSVCSKGLLRANHAPASSRLAADSPLATRFANFWLSTQETGFVHGFLQLWERKHVHCQANIILLWQLPLRVESFSKRHSQIWSWWPARLMARPARQTVALRPCFDRKNVTQNDNDKFGRKLLAMLHPCLSVFAGHLVSSAHKNIQESASKGECEIKTCSK